MNRWILAALIAHSIWGGVPGCMAVHHHREWMARTQLGYAMPPCTIVITRRRLDWERYCAIVIHEWGHLTGHRHSANPRSIMYPTYHGEPRCRARRSELRARLTWMV